jgi:polar amino acid transport system substrate-binding protein
LKINRLAIYDFGGMAVVWPEARGQSEEQGVQNAEGLVRSWDRVKEQSTVTSGLGSRVQRAWCKSEGSNKEKWMRQVITFVLTVFVMVVGMQPAPAQEPTKIGVCGDSGEWPPYVYFERENGEKTDRATGFSIDLVEEILTAEGIDYEIGMVPWKRCLHEVEGGANYQVVLDATYSEERSRSYYYSRPYYTIRPYYFYSRRDHPDGLDIWWPEDLKQYRISGVSGYNYADFHLTSNDIYSLVKDQDTLVRHVLNQRCDLFPEWFEVLAGFSVVGKDFLADPDLGYAPVPGLGETRAHMLFTRNETGKRLRRLVDRGIGKLEASGRLKELLLKYDVGGRK